MRIDTKLEAKGISAALYLRTSTKDQTVENQRIKLREFAKAMEWADVAEYADQESGVESAEYRKLRRRCVTRWNAQLPLATAGRSRLAIAHATRIRGPQCLSSSGNFNCRRPGILIVADQLEKI